MSIHLTPGYTFQTNEVLDADSLNALLRDAQAGGLVTADLVSGFRLIDTQSTAPGASLGYPWLDYSFTLAFTSGAILRFGDGATFVFADGILPFTYTGTVSPITKGTVVSLAPTDMVVRCGTYSTRVAMAASRRCS